MPYVQNFGIGCMLFLLAPTSPKPSWPCRSPPQLNTSELRAGFFYPVAAVAAFFGAFKLVLTFLVPCIYDCIFETYDLVSLKTSGLPTFISLGANMEFYLFTEPSLLIFFCNCKIPYKSASAEGGHPGT